MMYSGIIKSLVKLSVIIKLVRNFQPVSIIFKLLVIISLEIC